MIHVTGRVLLSLIFILSGLAKVSNWTATADYMTGSGMPFVAFFLAAAIVVEVGAGLALLFGVQTKTAAQILAAYLIPVTLIFHAFWSLDGMDRQMQLINFLKNLAILGGLLALSSASAKAVISVPTGKIQGPGLKTVGQDREKRSA